LSTSCVQPEPEQKPQYAVVDVVVVVVVVVIIVVVDVVVVVVLGQWVAFSHTD